MQIASVQATPAPYVTDISKRAQLGATASQTAPIISLERLDATETTARLKASMDLFLRATSTPFKMAKDAHDMANAMVSTMQSMVINRPDLATKHFDFKLDHGSIKVVSQELSADDKAWLEGQLNGNKALMDAATRYHDHAVDGYYLWGELDGQQVPADQKDHLSVQADKLTNFMDLFHKLGVAQKKGMFRDGTYYASNGSKVNFDQDTKTAIGFLDFMQSAQAVTSGNVTWVSPTGKIHHNVIKSDPFSRLGDFVMLVPPKPKSLGLHFVA